jgi:hypothetical protein
LKKEGRRQNIVEKEGRRGRNIGKGYEEERDLLDRRMTEY